MAISSSLPNFLKYFHYYLYLFIKNNENLFDIKFIGAYFPCIRKVISYISIIKIKWQMYKSGELKKWEKLLE
jgi:hypothetical protein